MLYCRKCGATLDEDARFCRVCGTPVTTSVEPSAAPAPRRMRRHYIIPVAILIAILVVALFFAVFALIPVQSVKFNQSNSAVAIPGVDTVRLYIQADVADINVIPTSQLGDLVRVNVSATGSTGLFGSANHPVQVSFSNETKGRIMTVTSKVTREDLWPFSLNLHVICNVYVDTSAVVNLTAQTTVGQVNLKNDLPATFQGLTLRSTTGSVQATMSDRTVFTGNVSATTTTGSVHLVWNNVQISQDTSLDLATTTGSITANVTQNRALRGNVTLKATTTTGSVTLGMAISGNVGTQITSHTTTGSVSVDGQNFNGNKSPIYSSNYPAGNNFIVSLGTTTGNVHIKATYLT